MRTTTTWNLALGRCVVALMSINVGAGTAQDVCEFVGEPPATVASFLQRAAKFTLRKEMQADREGACIMQALKRLAAPEGSPYANVVVEYIDIRFPKPPAPLVIHRLPPVGREYEAVTTLVRMGPGAIPAVFKHLHRLDITQVAREKAAFVFISLHGAQPSEALRTLRHASRVTDDANVARVLLEAAEEASKYCGIHEHAALCRDALRE